MPLRRASSAGAPAPDRLQGDTGHGRDRRRLDDGFDSRLPGESPDRPAQAGDDVQNLQRAVAAGVVRPGCAPARYGPGAAGALVPPQPPQGLLHLARGVRHEVVLAGPEQPVGVRPGRADQGRGAGQHLEDADGRRAVEHPHVLPAGDVQHGPGLGEGLRDAVIGQPAAVVDRRIAPGARAASPAGSARRRGRSGAPHAGAGRDGRRRRAARLARSGPPQLPTKRASSRGRWGSGGRGRKRASSAASCTTCTLSGPQPQALTVGGGERRTERQDGVAALQAQAGDAGRLGQDAVVGVVEEQAIATLLRRRSRSCSRAGCSTAGHSWRTTTSTPPSSSSRRRSRAASGSRVVEADVDEREPAPELHQGAQAGAGHQVRDRPAAGLLRSTPPCAPARSGSARGRAGSGRCRGSSPSELSGRRRRSATISSLRCYGVTTLQRYGGGAAGSPARRDTPSASRGL